jgi:hypothetical protein
MPAGPLALLDSNPFEDTEYAAKLFPVFSGRKWFSTASMRSVGNPKWVRTARANGCRGLVIGFESVNAEALSASAKSFNDVHSYAETCKILRGEGIAILGCFVFGLDGDESDVFARTVEFVDQNCLDLALYSIYRFPALMHGPNWERKVTFSAAASLSTRSASRHSTLPRRRVAQAAHARCTALPP